MKKKETTTIIWFTGVISKYDISKYDILHLEINDVALLYMLSTYKADRYIAVITVYNEMEKEQYIKLIRDKGLDDKLIFVFMNYDNNPVDLVAKLVQIYDVNYYIDCSRKRLKDLVPLVPPEKLIHVSQLLN